MPTVCILFGIQIIMNQIGKEHGKPHIHAVYGDERAVFEIENAKLIKGKLKPKQMKIVKTFINSYKDILIEMWETETIKKIEI